MDTMVERLVELVDGFEGPTRRTRCFAHIVNLIVKSIMRPFDVRTSKESASVLDETERALRELVEGLDLEEDEALLRRELDGEDGEGDEGPDDMDGWFDELNELTELEREELEEAVRPVKLVLVKVG